MLVANKGFLYLFIVAYAAAYTASYKYKKKNNKLKKNCTRAFMKLATTSSDNITNSLPSVQRLRKKL